MTWRWMDDDEPMTPREMARVMLVFVLAAGLFGGLMGWIAAWLQIPIN